MKIEIPQDILDIMHKTQYEHDEYCELGVDISVSRQGNIVVRDMMGMWDADCKDRLPDTAWQMIRKWWANEQDMIEAKGEKEAIEKKIAELKQKLDTFDEKAKKNKWHWW